MVRCRGDMNGRKHEERSTSSPRVSPPMGEAGQLDPSLGSHTCGGGGYRTLSGREMEPKEKKKKDKRTEHSIFSLFAQFAKSGKKRGKGGRTGAFGLRFLLKGPTRLPTFSGGLCGVRKRGAGKTKEEKGEGGPNSEKGRVEWDVVQHGFGGSSENEPLPGARQKGKKERKTNKPERFV